MIKRFLLILITALLALTLTACGGNKETGAPAPAEQPASQQEEKAGGPLDELMKNAQQAKEMSFEMVMTLKQDEEMTTTSKMFISGDNMRIESESMGIQAITIIDENDDTYVYMPDSNTAMKSSAFEDETTEVPYAWAEENVDMNVLGEEKMDGYDCLVVSSNEEGVETKMWLRKDIGMPVRVEIPSEGLVIEYKNYDIGPQDAGLFKLPAGVQITELPN